MKFKLVEKFEEFDKDVLNEKLWHEVSYDYHSPSGMVLTDTVYIYATNNAQALNTLQDAFNGKYRGQNNEQSFHRPVADSLHNNYANLVTGSERVSGTTTVPSARRLSRTDRSLRKEANKAGGSALGHDVLVHHKNGDEGDNTPNNLMIFDYANNMDKILASAGHVAAHATSNLTTGVPFTHSIDVHEYSAATGGYVSTHTITLTIT